MNLNYFKKTDLCSHTDVCFHVPMRIIFSRFMNAAASSIKSLILVPNLLGFLVDVGNTVKDNVKSARCWLLTSVQRLPYATWKGLVTTNRWMPFLTWKSDGIVSKNASWRFCSFEQKKLGKLRFVNDAAPAQQTRLRHQIPLLGTWSRNGVSCQCRDRGSVTTVYYTRTRTNTPLPLFQLLLSTLLLNSFGLESALGHLRALTDGCPRAPRGQLTMPTLAGFSSKYASSPSFQGRIGLRNVSEWHCLKSTNVERILGPIQVWNEGYEVHWRSHLLDC